MKNIDKVAADAIIGGSNSCWTEQHFSHYQNGRRVCYDAYPCTHTDKHGKTKRVNDRRAWSELYWC
jgi:hypothetical protein